MPKHLEGGRKRQPGDPSAEPLLSILVVVFNAREHLPPLLESIYSRKGPDVELIVVDGASHDGTQDYLQTQTRIDYWLSEPDRGIYDAMNKAIAAASGTFLLHLNVGDALLEIPRQELLQARSSGIDLLAFPVTLSGNRTFRPRYGLGLRFNNTLHHQGTFYRRATFPSYDTTLRVFADFDVNQRLALSGARAMLGKRPVAFHETDGVSGHRTDKLVKEFRSVVQKNHGSTTLFFAKLLGKYRGLKARLGLG